MLVFYFYQSCFFGKYCGFPEKHYEYGFSYCLIQCNKYLRERNLTMKILLFLISFFLFFGCNKQSKFSKIELPKSSSKLGTGIIHFNTQFPIPLYRTENDSLPYDTLKFRSKEFGLQKGTMLFETKTLGEKLQPYLLEKGDSDFDAKSNINVGLIRFVPQLIFRVQKKSENGVTVIINEETFETSYVKLNGKNQVKPDFNYFDPNLHDYKENPNWHYYQSWDETIRRAFSITPNKGERIYETPNGKLLRIEEADQYYTVDSIVGNWAKLSNYGINSYEKTNKGWLQWNRNDSITVHIRMQGGYE